MLKVIKESCPYEIKPFPNEFCMGCSLNGCYPWNRNPLLLCAKMGGLYVVVFGDEECLSRDKICAERWDSHLTDLMREADFNEKMRFKAMGGTVKSSELLPAEYVESLRNE